ncbi:MAG: hypothetical protein IBJ16_04130 [Chitinophagaceae bacterium]|nr:hypothetical protein [Chitinophagaceae bacterium]
MGHDDIAIEISRSIQDKIKKDEAVKNAIINPPLKFVERNWFWIMLLSGVINCALTTIVNIYLPFDSRQLIPKTQSKVDTVYVVNQTKHDTVYLPVKNKP